MAEQNFRILLMDEVVEFLKSIPASASRKINYNIKRVLDGERDVELFKKLENTEIWEFRTQYNSIAYRLFAFWDKRSGKIIVATHGVIKKTQKTPTKEIAKAERIRKEYLK